MSIGNRKPARGNLSSVIPTCHSNSVRPGQGIKSVSWTAQANSRRRERWIGRIVDYLYDSWEPMSRDDWELKTISLRLVSMARDGQPSLDMAAALAVGCLWGKWMERTEDRRQELADQYARCIPDYDPADGPLEPVSEGRLL